MNQLLDCFGLLLAKGANVEAQSIFGLTLLHCGAVYGHEPAVRLLLKSGTKVNVKPPVGKTLIQFTAINGHELIVQLLLEHKADSEELNPEGLVGVNLIGRGRERAKQMLEL